MKDLIVFSIGNNRYAMDIENIQRIIQASELTSIPNSHAFVDGMMSHEDSVLKVMNFRKLIGMPSYEDELAGLFVTLKEDHTQWLEALKIAIDTQGEFSKTFNAHMCELGKWIDGFTSYDDAVSIVLAKLTESHKQLHATGGHAYEMRLTNQSEAQKIFENEITSIYTQTMAALDTFTQELESVSNSLQKLLIYESEGKKFAIKVDLIEDIAHVDEGGIMDSDNNNDKESEFLKLDGILELNDILINVIKSVKLPS